MIQSIRIYAVDLLSCDNPLFDTLDQFMDEAERQGLVYTLNGFEKAFNLGQISNDWMIKIIDILNYKK